MGVMMIDTHKDNFLLDEKKKKNILNKEIFEEFNAKISEIYSFYCHIAMICDKFN